MYDSLFSRLQDNVAPVREAAAVALSCIVSAHGMNGRHMVANRDVNETLAYETKTRPRHSVFGPRRDRDQDLPAIPRDRDETETYDFCHETRPRPCKAETETFFETFKVDHGCTHKFPIQWHRNRFCAPIHSWRNWAHKL